MTFYGILMEHRIILKFLYTLLIVFICVAITLRADKLFRLSYHQGIRYFRNAFFFYGLSFILKYIFIALYDFSILFFGISDIYPIIKMSFEFFLIMAGFFLLYSMLWSKFENEEGNNSSFFNLNILIFYILALIVCFLDHLWTTYYFMFLLQIIIFSFASGIAFTKYIGSQRKQGFLKLYLFVIMLNLFVWIANSIVYNSFDFLVLSSLNWSIFGMIGIYTFNMVVFALFLFAVLEATNK